MREIQVLDQKTIDKIAAGEVVERPASVVKELVENAMDAGASAITVEIRDGGSTLIRITDNGSGIPKDQIRLAFLRHATSKIRRVEDLAAITSLGFRGEALSSIAAVSQVELITKIPESLTGVRYCIEGGTERVFEEIGAPSGTTFLVRHLFYNTPARAKFLKSPAAEGNAVASVVEQLALSHPELSFKFIQNGQNRLYTSGNGNVKEAVYQIYGRDITRELIPLEGENELFRIRGYIGKPALARANRNFENYFVNGRYVKSKLLAKAIEDAYHGFMMQHRYPFTLLYLEVDGSKVDVNVHPSKMELRFSNQEGMYHQLCLAIQNTLLGAERIPEIHLEKNQKAAKPEPKTAGRPAPPEPFETKRKILLAETPAVYGSGQGKSPEEQKKKMVPSSEPAPAVPAAAPEEPIKKEEAPQRVSKEGRPEQLELFREKLLTDTARPSHRILGQIFDTYWLVEYQNALYIIDQHAAHEKVLYERMMREFQNKQVTSQMLCPPMVLSLSGSEAQLVEKYADVFRETGYEIESFGGKEYKISAVPANLYQVAEKELFTEILDRLEEAGEGAPEVIRERLASMSCKAAVKGNQHLSRQEAEALIDELLTLENPYNCPHGRPTIVSMSRYDLDRKFKRIV